MTIRQKGGTICFILFIAVMLAPAAVFGVGIDLIVEEDGTSPHYSSIQSALNYVTQQTGTTNSFRILVKPGTYTVASDTPITLINNVPLIGQETARTVVTGGGAGTLMTANNVTGISIRNFTFKNASLGIQVTGTSSVSIENNIFNIGASGTAVQVQNSPGSSVVNNTFYENGTAVERDSDSVDITNNIFYSSAGTAQISQAAVATEATIKNNLFFPDINGPEGTDFIPNVTIPESDPLFVDPAAGDFHIEFSSTVSPAIDNGLSSITDAIDSSISDIGAYGGTNMDTIPFIVSGVTVTTASTTSALVSWLPNKSYVVTNTDPAKQGGYRVHYNLNQAGPPYDNVVSLASTSTSALISGLTATAVPPAAPVLNQPDFADQTLILTWSAVEQATKYFLHYTDLVTGTTTTLDVGNTVVYSLGGLVNGREYSITVSAVAQPAYHFSVTAFDSTGAGTPGVSHESDYSSDVPLAVGSAMESDPSNAVTAFPEKILANPNLPDSGCFIATAAYGYYSAPQVQTLRQFRDQYLMTNRAGRTFVNWYYRYGPVGAAYINEHAWLKPVVRTALLPAVGGAWFTVHSPLSVKIVVILVIGLLVPASIIMRRTCIRNGGVR